MDFFFFIIICLGNLVFAKFILFLFPLIFLDWPCWFVYFLLCVYTQSKFMFQNRKIHSPFPRYPFRYPTPSKEKSRPKWGTERSTRLLPWAKEKKGWKKKKVILKRTWKFRERNNVYAGTKALKRWNGRESQCNQ